MNMVKTLTIREDVYNKLAKMKKQGESFSELFLELMDRKRFTGEDLKKYMGILTEKEYRRMKKETKTIRRKISEDIRKREKRWQSF